MLKELITRSEQGGGNTAGYASPSCLSNPNHSQTGDCRVLSSAIFFYVDEFPIEDSGKNMAKWVRKGHVQTDEHWKNNWKPNRLKS